MSSRKKGGVPGDIGAVVVVAPPAAVEFAVEVGDERGVIIPAAVQPVDRHADGVCHPGVRSRVDRAGADHCLELRGDRLNDSVVVPLCCLPLDKGVVVLYVPGRGVGSAKCDEEQPELVSHLDAVRYVEPI